MSPRAAHIAVTLSPVVISPQPDGRLEKLIDWEALARCGYDPVTGRFCPHADDPIFGFRICKASNCDQVARTALGLCWRCHQWWQKAEAGSDFETFCEAVPDRIRYPRDATALCRVCRTPGHERPVWAHGLCAACDNAMGKRGQSLEEYVAGDEQQPPAQPRPSFGRCQVATCTRFAWRARPALCEPHSKSWASMGRPTATAFRAWCARQGSVDRDSKVVVLAGLAERPRLEILYGLQRAAEVGRKTKMVDVQTAVNIVRAQGVASICELSMEKVSPATQFYRFLTFSTDQVRLARSSPAAEAAKDDWDLRVFGHIPGMLRFGPISQGWLRDSAKAWAKERIDTVDEVDPLGRTGCLCGC